MSALSFSLRGESPTFSGLQLWLQGCAAFPHLLQETPPRKLFNPYFSASCAQAPPPPGSHPPLRLRRVGGPAPTPPQHSACTHSSAPVRLEAGRSRPHRALPLTPPPGPSAHTGRPGPIINDCISFEARQGTGANTNEGPRREEGGEHDGDGSGETGWAHGAKFRGALQGEKTLPRGGPQNGTGRPGG